MRQPPNSCQSVIRKSIDNITVRRYYSRIRVGWYKPTGKKYENCYLNREKKSIIYSVSRKAFQAIFLCQPGLGSHQGTSTLISSFSHLWVSRLAACCKFNFSSHSLITQEAISLSTSHCVCQVVRF